MVLGYSNIVFAKSPKILGSPEFMNKTNKAIELLQKKDYESYLKVMESQQIIEKPCGDTIILNIPTSSFGRWDYSKNIYVDYNKIKLYFGKRNAKKVIAVVISHEAWHYSTQCLAYDLNQWEIETLSKSIETAKKIRAPKKLIRALEYTIQCLEDK